MLILSRKRKESKEIKLYLNNKPLEQMTTMKYLGIVIDSKFKFSEHISYAAQRCMKLIHSLSRSAKISWGLQHEALQTIYKGAILPLLLYESPVWIEAMQYEHNRHLNAVTHEHKNGQSVLNNIKQSIMDLDRNDPHNY